MNNNAYLFNIIVYNMHTMDEQKRVKALFIIPSVIGILLFMIPMKINGVWTIIVKVLADAINGVIGPILPHMCVVILTVSAVLAIIARGKPKFIIENEVLIDCFCCTVPWLSVRILGCIFAWLTLLEIGSEKSNNPLDKILGLISGPDQGGVALDLISGLVIIFAIASFLLPLLLDFGLLEYAHLQPVRRRLLLRA